MFFNSEGVIFYTDTESAYNEAVGVGLASLSMIARRTLVKLTTKVSIDAVITAGSNIAMRAAATQGRAISSARVLSYRVPF